MKLLSNLSIRTKFLLLPVIAAGLILVLGAIFLSAQETQRSQLEQTVSRDVPKMREMFRLFSEFSTNHAEFISLLASSLKEETHEGQVYAQGRKSVIAVNRTIEGLDQLSSKFEFDAGQQQISDRLRQRLLDYRHQLGSTVFLASVEVKLITQFTLKANQAYNAANNEFLFFIDAVQEGAQSGVAGVQSTSNANKLWFNTILGATILFILLSSILLSRLFTSDIKYTIEALSRLVRGDTDIPEPAANRGEEFGAVNRAIQAFRQVLIQRDKAEQELRIAAIAFETEEGILIADQHKRIIRVNHAFSRLTGYSAEEAIGQTPAMLRSGRQDAEFYRSMWEAIARDKYWQGEIWSRRKDGEIFPGRVTITAVTDAGGQVTHYVAVYADITLQKESEQKIHQLAFYDPLTKLPNRSLLRDRLRQALAHSIRNKTRGAVLFIDLDNFKTLNDTQGHNIGDLLLIEVAKRLQDCVRSDDTVARLGGDEFVVILGDLSPDAQQAVAQAKAVGEKALASINQPFNLQGLEHHGSSSIGISLFHGNEVRRNDLLKQADSAMYQAKSAGRNTLRFFDPAMQAALEARSVMEADLRQALALQQLKLYYQIQVNEQGVVVGAEALLRWQHPERGLVAPMEFIPLAEDTGLIVPIGRWVLQTACAQLKMWQADPLTCHLQLAVNVSARQFRQPDFVDQVLEALKETGVDPLKLGLELTESLVLHDIADSIDKMQALRIAGVGFSLDDFGTGQSSLSYLKRLPLDQIKIDRSFVFDIATDPSDAVIVQTIIGMANNLGLEVIAEGVETEQQRDFLGRNGCHLYQGYLFSRPVPIESFKI
ncbi:MAG: EAL domain-containing protein [Gammaproteobacteria bacterium]|nr:EAL domain-containing protein [Gammaproteobacteria bacterium]